MFQTVGVIVTTTAGAGLGHTAKTIQNSLKFWGVKKIFSYRKAVNALKWSEVPEEKEGADQQGS